MVAVMFAVIGVASLGFFFVGYSVLPEMPEWFFLVMLAAFMIAMVPGTMFCHAIFDILIAASVGRDGFFALLFAVFAIGALVWIVAATKPLLLD